MLISEKDLERIRRRKEKEEEEARKMAELMEQGEAELDNYVSMIEGILGNRSTSHSCSNLNEESKSSYHPTPSSSSTYPSTPLTDDHDLINNNNNDADDDNTLDQMLQ